ncbi:NLR family CARD domain-containing protein 4-like [Centruroides vittatus]|uniref:NLR family CARD domain-containing protein 4-like n=1 Tax=Centruroides vittatus TaxID=120091 RepID=UPI00350F8C26
MNRYEYENAYMTSFLWSEDYDFPIREGFVDVNLHKTDMLGRKTGEIIQIKDIFAKESKLHRTVLITGDPGYGKTTICKKIAYDWGMDEDSRSYLKSFHILIFIQLSELGEKSVIDAVIECIDDRANRQFAKKLRETEWNFLIILDGFNESRDKDCVKQFISDDSIEMSVQMTIIVTSSPHVSDKIRKLIEYRCYIKGFSPEQKEKYIDLIVRDEDKCEYLKNIIKNNRFCFELAKCPLMLYMLCCLPKSKSDRHIMTNADVFMLIFRLIIEKYKKEKKENILTERI